MNYCTNGLHEMWSLRSYTDDIRLYECLRCRATVALCCEFDREGYKRGEWSESFNDTTKADKADK